MASTVDEFGHRHGRACYWDHETCGWVCSAPAPEPAVEVIPAPVVAAEPASSG